MLKNLDSSFTRFLRKVPLVAFFCFVDFKNLITWSLYLTNFLLCAFMEAHVPFNNFLSFFSLMAAVKPSTDCTKVPIALVWSCNAFAKSRQFGIVTSGVVQVIGLVSVAVPPSFLKRLLKTCSLNVSPPSRGAMSKSRGLSIPVPDFKLSILLKDLAVFG